MVDPVSEGKGKGFLEERMIKVKKVEEIQKSAVNQGIEIASGSNEMLKLLERSGKRDYANNEEMKKNSVMSVEKEDGISIPTNDQSAKSDRIGGEPTRSFVSTWQKVQHIKVNFNSNSTKLSEDGMAVKLNPVKEMANAQILKKSLVIKVLGQNIPFSVCSQELRRQWNIVGGFHMTLLRNIWILYSFTSIEFMEEILNGGPWYIGNHIIGMDRWTTSSTDSLKGVSSPCDRVGQHKNICPELANIQSKKPVVDESVENQKLRSELVREDFKIQSKEEYGPWIHVKFKTNRYRNNVRNGEMLGPSKQIYKLVEKVEQNMAESKGRIGSLTENIQGKSANQEEVNVTTTSHRLAVSENYNGKVKLSKELRSLGLVEADQRKRGARKREASLYLREFVKDNDCFFVGLTETKMSCLERQDIDSIIGVDWDYCFQPLVGLSEVSSQLILGNLNINNLGNWKVATVYGGKDVQIYRNLWHSLEVNMQDDNTILIGGDFNCILSKEDKKGGKRFQFSCGPKEMKVFLTNNDLHDNDYVGPRFTWCNNKEGNSRIWERLDRCFINSIALQRIPMAKVRHLSRVSSDHSPIVLNLVEKQNQKSKFIIFKDSWKSFPAAWHIAIKAWRKSDYGSSAEILQRKLKRTLKALYFSNKNKCKDLNLLKEKLKEDIQKLQLEEEVCSENFPADRLNLLRSKISHLVEPKSKNQMASRWGQEFQLLGWPSIPRNLQISDKEADLLKTEFTKEELIKAVFTQVKLDMEQAYDNMSWDALEHMLQMVGMPVKIIGLIMEFVKGARFSFIINGKASKWITAANGFCQVKELHYLGVQLLLRKPMRADFQFLIDNKGGSNLHSAVDRSGPLKARLTWRLIQEPESLLSHVVIAKHGNDVWNIKNKRNTSVTWKVLNEGARYLKPLLRWRIANGRSIDVVKDVWLLDKSFSEWPLMADCLGLEGLKLNHFIDSNGSWKEELLCYFNEDLITLIIQIKIEREILEDFMEEIHSLSGKTITARAYEAHCSSKQDYEAVSARVEVFWWRVSRGVIPTNEFLKFRRIYNDDRCIRGCGEVENLLHITTGCRHLQEELKKIQEWGIFVPVFNSMEDYLCELKRLSMTAPNVVILYYNVVYWNWKNRNEVAHGKQANTVTATVENVLSTAYLSSHPLIASWGANLPREFQTFWHPPPQEWIKINVDAALLSSYNTGIGGCFRDDKGRLLIAFGENRTHWDIANLELAAVSSIRKYLQPWMVECKKLIIEGYNINVIKFIQDSLNKAKWQSYNRIDDSLLFLADFNKLIFNIIHRNGNKVADMCATMALDNNFCFDSFSFSNIPSSLGYLLKKECEHLL
ncbi:hypothetical protein KFK09_001791 [Dendrobium nobile]|uniref:RNase H type-1 domain-containing protein n=1 Tax=Dendrobium nobile TaxID=94219 RepID=A0A8T3C976_DENNO|nr:hypothetical protein KFK09_001791 [Dendrobium nobile]